MIVEFRLWLSGIMGVRKKNEIISENLVYIDWKFCVRNCLGAIASNKTGFFLMSTDLQVHLLLQMSGIT